MIAPPHACLYAYKPRTPFANQDDTLKNEPSPTLSGPAACNRPRMTATKSRKSTRSNKPALASLARRIGVAFVLAATVGFQATSCSNFQLHNTAPTAPALPAGQPAQQQTQFKACPQFFARGIAPAVPSAPKQRELCYEAFAILHSGETRTPVFVAERLNRQSILDADEKRGDKFFGDARLPRAERAELTDYKGSGYARGPHGTSGRHAHAGGHGAKLQPGQHGAAVPEAKQRPLGQDREGHQALRIAR